MKIRVGKGMWFMLILTVGTGMIGMARRQLSVAELWEQGSLWLTVGAAALLHELGHFTAARLVGVQVSQVKADLFGARLELGGLISYPREWLVAACGPLVNVLCGVAAYPPAAAGKEWAVWFVGASLTLAAVNLLPVETLDGGRMLSCAVAWLFGDAAAVAVTRVTTGVCMGLLWMLSVYALLRAEQLLSVFVFSLCLLLRCIKRGENC